MPPQPEPAHYFSSRPATDSRPAEVDLVLAEGRLLHLRTDTGVFSGDRVDPGTKLLLATAPAPTGARTLVDLGCGYGPIALTMALRADAGAGVWAVDVNERARALCAGNAERNGLGDRVTTVGPEDFPEDLTIDLIWSNPPIRIGKAALHDMLSTWLGRLAAEGHAVLVVNRNLGADSLARWLDSEGYRVERLTSRAGYRVLDVTPRSAR